MSKKDLPIRVFQLCSSDSLEQNARLILDLLENEAKEGEFCFFPENSAYINIDKNKPVPKISLEHEFFQDLKSLCQKKNLFVHLGSVPLYEGDKLYNQTILVDAKGALSESYKKIHLFRAHVGKTRIDEADIYTSGAKPEILELNGWKVGLSICYDIRFSHLYFDYAQKGCDLILAPSAFINETGKAHWEILLRARAIESQCYVVAPAQVGTHVSDNGSIRKSYGHSIAINPWGDVLFDLEKRENLSESRHLKYEDIEKMRQSLVMDRDLYK